MRSRRWCTVVAGIFVFADANFALAQQAAASARIPIRQLSAAEAVTRDTIGVLSGLREFADGSVLVNDMLKRRLVLFSKDLGSVSVVADSSGKPTLYPTRTSATGFFDYLGDSAVLADAASSAFLVIAPSGKMSRAMAPPSARDMTNLGMASAGAPAFDARGRFIYRGPTPVRPRPQPGAVSTAPPRTRDTVPILRGDFDSRKVDTIAHVNVAITVPMLRLDAQGKAVARMIINPLPQPPDEWVVTTDGSLAIIRPGDYHVDWVLQDGTRLSTPKMPFDWRPLKDEDKQARIDSVKRVIDSLKATPQAIGKVLAVRPGGGGIIDTIYASIEFPPLSEMPDFVPPFRANTAKADRDNNVWIPPTTSFAQMSGFVYDVINRKGEILERVAIPGGRLLAGFGPGGVVYLTSGNRTTGFVLERRRIIRTGS